MEIWDIRKDKQYAHYTIQLLRYLALNVREKSANGRRKGRENGCLREASMHSFNRAVKRQKSTKLLAERTLYPPTTPEETAIVSINSEEND